MESNNHEHPFGKPVSLLNADMNNKVVVDNVCLEKMLLHPEVKNRKVVVFSIVGAFRKGKSFFLDYCLRFLYANVSLRVD
jgi:atlastin